MHRGDIVYCIIGEGWKVVTVFFPSVLSLSTMIKVADKRRETFKVICTSTGGRPITMSVTGPSGDVKYMMDVVEVGTVEGIGNDVFYTLVTVKKGRNDDSYLCTVYNGVSNYFNSSTLRGSYI